VARPAAATQRRVVAIDDDPEMLELLKVGLRYEGFEVWAARDGRAGLDLVRSLQPDLVLIELMLPDIEGRELCRRIRGRSEAPVLVLSARGEVGHKVRLLEAGADDYLVKPFDFDELLARMRALLRRRRPSAETPELRFGDLCVRAEAREVTRNGLPVALTAKEFDLLHYFLRHPRRVLSKEALLDHVWGYQYDGGSNIVEVYVGLLRRKLGPPRVIQTVRGAGYALRE